MRKPAFLMLGAISLFVVPSAQGAVDTVFASGFTFSPNAVTITVGDTILWKQVSGSHTTTSGTGPGDPEAGLLWNKSLTSASPEYQRQFNTSGSYPFYCIPHVSFGMTGTITVEEPLPCSCPFHGDPHVDGVINVLDVVQTVNVAFRGFDPVFDEGCPIERTDVDCSGFTNVLDVVRVVSVAFRGGDPATEICEPCL